MIRNGRPYTVENGYVDKKLISERPFTDLSVIDQWIRNNIRKSRSIYKYRTSYGLKHILERDTGLYLTNNEFKDAMLLSGYEPVDSDELNWRYRIKLVIEEVYNPSPFYKWLKETCKNEDLPQANFANDMLEDPAFPCFAEKSIILGYLGSIGACPEAEEVFKALWNRYRRERWERKKQKKK